MRGGVTLGVGKGCFPAQWFVSAIPLLSALWPRWAEKSMTNGTITIASFAQHDDPPETIATDAAQPSEVDARFRHMDSAQIVGEVQKHYTTFAKSHNVKYSESVAKSFGYSEEALAAVSQDANLGLSCGNPLAVASVREVSSSA